MVQEKASGVEDGGHRMTQRDAEGPVLPRPVLEWDSPEKEVPLLGPPASLSRPCSAQLSDNVKGSASCNRLNPQPQMSARPGPEMRDTCPLRICSLETALRGTVPKVLGGVGSGQRGGRTRQRDMGLHPAPGVLASWGHPSRS